MVIFLDFDQNIIKNNFSIVPIFEFLKFMFVSESLNSIRFEHDLASLSSLDSDLSNPSMAFRSFKFAINGQISSRLVKKSVEVIARSLKITLFRAWQEFEILNFD